MYKYIQDGIRNNSRLLLKDLTLPQKKTVMELIRGLFVVGKPVLRHLAQNKSITSKKQADKYSHHLGNIKLKKMVEQSALNKVKRTIRKSTIIAYDLTDINKSAAKKMANISTVFDGSKRCKAPGYTLHGLGINGILIKLEVHNGMISTQNQIRQQIVEKYSAKLGNKGIWVFDRGNDDKAFFKFLRHKANVQFITRLRANRGLVDVKTGAIVQVQDLLVGRYEVFLKNKNNNSVDTRSTYTLIIHKHLTDQNKQPIRLLAALNHTYSTEEIVNMYLERWGIENSFKRAKQKFNLEMIRVLDYQKFVNLVSLIQFAVNVSTIMFIKLQKLTNALVSGVLIYYKSFIKRKNLTQNIDSFISFIRSILKPLIFHQKHPPNQRNLFSYQILQKLGPF